MNARRAGAGLGLATLLGAPAAAQADDFNVTNLNDDGSGSLRNALEAANADPSADRILFKSKLSGEISLQDNLVIDEPVTIVGPGARRVTVDGNDGRILGIGDAGAVTISGLRLTNSHARPLASSGGAISASGDLTLLRMQLSGNLAENSGGAVAIFDGSLTIENSTISGNDAENVGGGVYARDSDVSIRSSTISGNESVVSAGGVFFYNSGPNPSLEVLNSTISRNQADYVGGINTYLGYDNTIRGSIVAGNGGGYAQLDPFPGFDVSFSLIDDPPASGINDGGGNVFGLDPKLKPLKDNGGPTDTHAFKKSPAKNTGPSDAPNSDQRGAPRKGAPDIGAYELVKCEGVIVNRVGTAKKDKLKGTKRKDGILGLGGNDKLSGKKGKDGLCGGQGKDKLKGGPGKDKLDGGPGKDKEVQ